MFFHDLREIFNNSIKYASRNTVIPNFDPEIADSFDEEGDVDTEAESEYADDSTTSCAMPSTEGYSEILHQTLVTKNKQTFGGNTSTPMDSEASPAINNQPPENTETEDVNTNLSEDQSTLQEWNFQELFRTDQFLDEQMMDIDFQAQENDLMGDVGNGKLMPLHQLFVETENVDFHEEMELDGFV